MIFFTSSLSAIQIPDTDQQKCFNENKMIPCPNESEPFYGQDAHYSINPHQFVKLDANGNELPDASSSWIMVLDQVTGLIWEVKTDDNSVHDKDNKYKYYYLEEKFIKRLNQDKFGGFSDWRLPKANELNTLASIYHDQPSIDSTYFPQTIPYDYWSETPHSENNSQGWCVSFYHGNDSIQSRQSEFHVRAVRGEIYYDPERFVDNGDGTITDTVTGLMWQQETSLNKNWTDALSSCQELELAGYSDWRLPGREVLRSIVDYTRYAPSLDMRFFIKSMAAAYWSSTTDQQEMNKAWCIHFQYGNDVSRNKNSLYAIRAVRGGQKIQENHVKIISPSPGDRLNSGMKTVIMWDSAGIIDTVDIQLSKFGGLNGSFENIISDTDNDGLVEWIVSGESSENCVIRIVPNNHPSAFSEQGMFSIDHFSGAWIDTFPLNGYQSYRLMLLGQYSEHIEPLEAQWQIDETPGTTLSGNTVSSLENHWVKIFTRFENLTYERWIALFNTTDMTESEPNSTKEDSLLMAANHFYSGSIANEDLDIFKIGLFADEIVQIAFLPDTDYADYHVHIFDENGIHLYEKVSSNGQSFQTELGLTEGNYYIHITSYGDVLPNNTYTLSYISTGPLPGNDPISIAFGEILTGRNSSLVDIPIYEFSIVEPTGVIIDFYPSNYPVGYMLVLKNPSQTIAQMECLDQKHKHLEIFLAKENYTIEIQAKNQVDRSAQFKLSLTESSIPIEKETNDSFQTATSIDIQLPVRGNISSLSDLDIFYVEQFRPEIRLLTFTEPEDDADTWITIYKDSDDHPIYQFQVNDGTFFSKNVGFTVGRYYIQLASHAETGNFKYYTLELKSGTEITVEIEPNNNKNWCNTVSKEVYMRGMIFPETDTDWYGFYMDNPNLVEFTFEALNPLAVYEVNLIDNNDAVLSSRTISQSQVYTASWSLPSGNAYIVVKGNGDYQSIGDYRFRLKSNQFLTGIKRIQSIAIINPPEILTVGQEYSLSSVVYFSNADIQPLTQCNWTSLNQSIVTISSTGVMTAYGKGETSIIAEFKGKIAECPINVNQMPSSYVQDYGELILIAGSHESESASRFQTTQYLANMVYTRFQERRFKHDDIYYLNAIRWHDLDGDGYDDNIVDMSPPTTSAFVDMFNHIKTSDTSTGPLYIYLVGPSGNNSFEIAPNEFLSILLLKEMLNSFTIYQDRPVIIIMESPKAGQFVDALFLQNNHVFIASSYEHDTQTMLNGYLSFTQFFFDALIAGNSIGESFLSATVSVHSLRQPFLNMTPQLIVQSTQLTDNIWLGGNFALTIPSIEMTAINSERCITANETQDIEIQITDTSDVSQVYGMISSPDYLIPSSSADFVFPDTHRSYISLSHESDGFWKTTYDSFEYSGRYWIDICVVDTKNHVSLSQAFSFSSNNGKPTDMDFDGMPDNWEDSYIGLDKTVHDSQNDLDEDGLNNLNEYLYQCDPTMEDTDQDHLNDGWEVQHNLNPVNPSDAWTDADGDHVSNYQEFLDETDPQDKTSFVQHYGNIRGEIYTDLVGYVAGIKGAAITLLETGTQTYSTQEGLFLFRNMPYDRYTVQISAEHFKGYIKTTVLSSSNVFIGSIRLLYESEQLGCDYNHNDILDLPDIIRSLQLISDVND